MPAGKVFIDTNTLLYIHDKDAGGKADLAVEWLYELTTRQIACINLQVLNELTFVMLRRKWLTSPAQTFAAVDQFEELGSMPLTESGARAARQLHHRYRYSWWDCLLLASAIELGCTHFLSEDLKNGQTIEGLTIIDPFAHTPGQILVSR
jgi:predicted nucleic acid-binding protein